jgi:zinc protease
MDRKTNGAMGADATRADAARTHDIAFSEYDLDNGLHVILAPSHHVPIVVTNLWYHVGSKDDPPSRTGFAHLFEHMMFQGSRNIGKAEHFKYVLGAGGSLNATTNVDRTNYFETLPSTELETALWLESDRLLALDVTHENFENQRNVVKEERRQRYDNRPYGTVWENIAQRLWPTSGYHWTTIGSMDHLDQATVEDARAFHSEFYKPNNCSLVLVGDFKESEAGKLIDRYFGPIPKGKPVDRIQQDITPTAGQVRFTLEDAVKLPAVYLAFQSAHTLDREEYALDLLSFALASGRSSRLYQELVYRRKIARSADAANSGLEKSGVFYFDAKVQSGSSVEEVEEAMWGEIEKVKRAPLLAMELEKAKNRAEMDVVNSLVELGHRADRLQRGWCFKRNTAHCTGEIDMYRSITVEEIQNAANERLDRSHCVVGHVVPK